MLYPPNRLLDPHHLPPKHGELHWLVPRAHPHHAQVLPRLRPDAEHQRKRLVYAKPEPQRTLIKGADGFCVSGGNQTASEA